VNRAPVLLVAVLASGCTAVEVPAASPSGPAPTAPPPSATLDADVPASVDATLLGVLPEAVGDAPVVEDVEEAAVAVADVTLSRIATAIDVGVALDEATGNLVIAHVVRLREGAFDDATFRQWRDSFDEGACAGAGGVEGHAQVPIAERRVYVTSCAAEQRIYHLWAQDDGLLISASAVGPGRFGEVLMNGLRIP